MSVCKLFKMQIAEEKSKKENKIKKTSLLKRLAYFGLLFLFVFFLAEALLSIAFHYKYGNNKSAIKDLLVSLRSRYYIYNNPGFEKKEQYRNQELVRPDSSKEMNHQVFDEMNGANAFEFDPWLQFRNKPFAGKYVNVSGYIRKTIPDFVQKSADTFNIWFFGGSTMFGFNVADAETIPSYLAQLYQENKVPGKSLKIINYGARSYFSFHEFKLLQDRLLFEKSPDLVIFMDGLNEIVSIPTTLFKEPEYSGHLREYFKQHFIVARGKNITDSIRAYYAFTKTWSTEAIADTIFNNYLFTVNAVQQMQKLYNFQSLFVWQPVPYYNYANQEKDPTCDKNSYPVYNVLNPKIQTAYMNVKNSLYLADLLQNEKNMPFVDRVHYSPAFNKKIASLILQKINLQLTL